MDTLRFLDILGFVVGLVYLILEYKASIWLWLASIIMPAIDMVLYFKAGLYADFGMAIYYCLAGVYGYMSWKWFKRSDQRSEQRGERPVTRYKRAHILPSAAALLLLWFGIWWMLTHWTNSTVPVADAFTTALSIVALWALAQKYAEQWLLWLVVDVVCCILYVRKGIPFKAAIYGLYTVVAIFGYRKWLKMVNSTPAAS
ncbi:nicotinamide mononucleotide transporter [Bacteroidales bacterium WCE2004]|nr:nicotinamide mononucleotide transporter [Bacteroidales bacterium]SKC37664.1 nicotinamide mononucleotide transporter [Bacteroidales bacterium WCE2004]